MMLRLASRPCAMPAMFYLAAELTASGGAERMSSQETSPSQVSLPQALLDPVLKEAAALARVDRDAWLPGRNAKTQAVANG